MIRDQKCVRGIWPGGDCAIVAAALTFLVAFAGAAAAAPPFPLRPTFKVNTHAPGTQRYPVTAADGAGAFVVVWQSADQDASGGYGFFGQLYDYGQPVGAEFQANVTANDTQWHGSVAMRGRKEFLVAWQSGNQDGSDWGIFGRHFGPGGPGPEIRVNDTTAGKQVTPDVAASDDGGFVVVWASDLQDGSSYGIYGKRFDRSGTPIGSEFQVNTRTAGPQVHPSVCAARDGGSVVVWQVESGEDGSEHGVLGQRFDAGGNRRGGEFQVNSFTQGIQGFPAVGCAPSGSFIVAWHGFGPGAGGFRIFARRFDRAGNPIGSEFQVNEWPGGSQHYPSVAVGDDGDFVVTWASVGQDGSDEGIYARLYRRTGKPVGGEFLVDAQTVGPQKSPSVAFGGNGTFVIAWNDSYLEDHSYAIFARDWAAVGCRGKPITVYGTRGNDVLEGSPGPDVMHGFDGGDAIYGRGDGDTICGGGGGDALFGNDGEDFLDGGPGPDILFGGPKADFLAGGGADDELTDRRGANTLRGGRGTDACDWGTSSSAVAGCESRP